MASLLTPGYFPTCAGAGFVADAPFITLKLADAMRLYWVQRSLEVKVSFYGEVGSFGNCDFFSSEFEYDGSTSKWDYAADQYPEDLAILQSYYTVPIPTEKYLPCLTTGRCVAFINSTNLFQYNDETIEGCVLRSTSNNAYIAVSMFWLFNAVGQYEGGGGWDFNDDGNVMVNFDIISVGITGGIMGASPTEITPFQIGTIKLFNQYFPLFGTNDLSPSASVELDYDKNSIWRFSDS